MYVVGSGDNLRSELLIQIYKRYHFIQAAGIDSGICASFSASYANRFNKAALNASYIQDYWK